MRTFPYLVSALFLMLGAAGYAACGPSTANERPQLDADPDNDGSGTGDDGPLFGTGGESVVINATGGTPEEDPCLGENPPADLCKLVPSGPSCGDGNLDVDTLGEACDDGNTLPGDCCNGICKVEPNCTCPPGEPCTFDFECGNGEIEPGEVCDDGNATGDDGCSADCAEKSQNFVCITPGQPCERIVFCGDGRVAGAETCEDGNTSPGDGCDADCNLEMGWLCPTPGQPCEPSPMCGDAVVTPGRGEACDDGNTEGGDGCAADCTFMEDGWSCATPGQPCANLNDCGDGIVTGGESCDDGDEAPGDGCDALCQIEVGYECPFPGAPCIALCGDGILLPSMEICDDGNRSDGDGCTSTCRWEDGFACTGTAPNYTCHTTTCGDGRAEGNESCDDGNNDMGDGCSPICGVEPICDAGACTSACGDGLLLNQEQCDDGNAVNGDGCSSTCQIEPGYECHQPPLGETMVVPVVYRDFKESHADFEPGATGCDEVSPNMAAATLDADGKPTLGTGSSSSPGCNYVSSAATFAEWYRDVPSVNATIATTMTLWANGNGGYVNRYTEDGDPYVASVNTGNEQGGYGTSEATCYSTCTTRTRDNLQCENVCRPEHDQVDQRTRELTQAEQQLEQEELQPTPNETRIAELEAQIEELTVAIVELQATADACDADCAAEFATREAACQAQCLPCSYDAAQWCIGGELVEFGGSPTFFPIDDSTFDTARSTASIPDAYGGTWQDDPTGVEHNFWFTSEVRFWFAYDASVDQILTFTGDDDVWVFINNRLAVDLGGIHTPLDGSVNVRDVAARLNLTDGNVYEIVVFQAERQTTGSSYKLTLSGFNAAASECGPICGDGVVSPGEACDDGENVGGYGHCNPDCTRGAYCGDGVVEPDVEACDDGRNVSAYSLTSATGGCAPGCRAVPYCGDGVVQGEFGERCDLGTEANTGAYGGCMPDCQRAPFCGDAVTQPDQGEECDDGLNNGAYDTCAPECKLGPRCGDGVFAPEWGEICDDGNVVGGDGCSPTCGEEGICGDALVQAESGEVCDDGVNDGGYGECGPNCQLGPHCGDGVVDPEHEECDDRTNAGGYGECAPGCVLGPRCGDAIVQPGYEECDDGNDKVGDLCTPTCKAEVPVAR